jgi:hypothetical protein
MPTFKKNKEQMDSLVIGSGHSIMAGFIPASIPKEEFVENFYKWKNVTPETISSFGFFGGDIDYNTYYPNLTPEELAPKNDEFVEPMFRLLSSTIVSKNYNPTDFSQGNVLKASMPLLLGQTVNCDHETNIGNAIGAVSQVVWQDAYRDGNFVIPAGINGVLKIDGKANPRIARGILMEPPSIHSNSVTVQFKWDKSHPELDDNDFYEKLGTYDSKGNMVRRMVTEVVRYLETSLVSHGADSFAQKIGDNGKIINPTYAKRTWQSYSEYQEDKSKQYFFSDFKTDSFSEVKNSDTNEYVINSNNNKSEDMTLEEFIQTLMVAGIVQLADNQEPTGDAVLASLKNVITEYNKIKGINTTQFAEITALKESIKQLEAKVVNLQDMATVGTNHIAALRETVVANYKKLKGDAVDETIITMLNSDTTGLQTLISLNKDYQAQLEEKFPMTCSKCGSHDISRSSSIKQDEKEDIQHNQETEDPFSKLYTSKLK